MPARSCSNSSNNPGSPRLLERAAMDFLAHFIQAFRGLFGAAVLLGLAWLLSNNRMAISWRLVLAGIGLQLVIAALALRVRGVTDVFDWFAKTVIAVLNFAFKGSDILLGGLADPVQLHATLAISVFSTIVFVSALTALLYYFRILPWIVFGMAWVMQRLMGLSGPECLAAAANVFVGQTEAPLLVKPYLARMTRSELMALMCGGMATIAGSVLFIYVQFAGGTTEAGQQAAAKLLITASLMSAPAALVMAKILVPETEPTESELMVPRHEIGHNALDAITRGASDGLKLAMNVLAMIVAFYGLIMLGNAILGWIGGVTHLNSPIARFSGGAYETLSVQSIAALIFAPFGWIIGAETKDIFAVGELIGTKICFTDFVAFKELGDRQATAGALGPKSVFVTVFALCGFANFASIGVQLGGIGAIEPSQRKNLAALGFKAMIGGALASLITAAIAGIFYAP